MPERRRKVEGVQRQTHHIVRLCLHQAENEVSLSHRAVQVGFLLCPSDLEPRTLPLVPSDIL